MITQEPGRCTNCSADLSEGGAYCPNCGEIVYPRRGVQRRLPGWLLFILGFGVLSLGLVGGCGLLVAVVGWSQEGHNSVSSVAGIIALVCLASVILLIRLMNQMRRGRR